MERKKKSIVSVIAGKETLNNHEGFGETARLPFQRSHCKESTAAELTWRGTGSRVPTQRDCQSVYPPAAAQIRKIATQQGRINFLPFCDGIIKTTTVGWWVKKRNLCGFTCETRAFPASGAFVLQRAHRSDTHLAERVALAARSSSPHRCGVPCVRASSPTAS